MSMDELERRRAELPDEALLTVEEVARWLRVTEESVRRWARAGELEGSLISTRSGWRFTREAVEEFLRSRSNKA